jgi:hypothetical protein
MVRRDSRQSSLPARWKRRQASDATRFARPLETSSGCPVTTYGWDSAETSEGPTCGRSANRACQLAPPWSRNDKEDGGPTIQFPAADARCTLRSLSCVQYTRDSASAPFSAGMSGLKGRLHGPPSGVAHAAPYVGIWRMSERTTARARLARVAENGGDQRPESRLGLSAPRRQPFACPFCRQALSRSPAQPVYCGHLLPGARSRRKAG